MASLVNLVEDPSFENSIFGGAGGHWGTYQPGGDTGVAVRFAAAFARTGGFVCRLTADATGQAYIGVVGGGTIGNLRFPVEPDTDYSAAGYTWASGTVRQHGGIFAWYTAAGTLISSISGPAQNNANTGWSRTRVVTGRSPSNAASAQVYTQILAPAANEIHYVDDVLVLEGQYTDADFPAYFDGRTKNAEWLGLPDASQSRFPAVVAEALIPGFEIEATRRPWAKAQELLAGPGRPLGSFVAVGWHGTEVYPESGAIAVVRDTGPYVDLVGDVVKVTIGGRSCFAYVAASRDVPADLSLSRRAFASLGGLWLDRINALVEVVEK